MAICFTGLGAVVLRTMPNSPSLMAAYAAGVAASFARVAIAVAYRARPRDAMAPENLLRWERIFAGGSFLFAASLGAFGAVTVASQSALARELVLALLFGYCGGVVARLSPRPWIGAPTLALAIVPPVVAFAIWGDFGGRLLAVVAASFALGGAAMMRDIDRLVRGQVALHGHLAGLAHQDALTGLANRLLLEERLAAELADPARCRPALHYIDLDRFKPVNDRFGHAVGDALLRAVGARLGGLLREGDLAARLGGDEFVVLQHGVTDPSEAERLGRRIVRALDRPFAVQGHVVRVGASVGLALAPEHGTVPETLMAAADAALYRAKAHGRNRLSRAESAPQALAS